jgi:Tol biopolymer transport system component
MGACRTLLAGVVFLTVACRGDGPPGPSPPSAAPLPPLEVIPFEALGATKVVFQRIGPMGRWYGAYGIDGTARTSTPIFSVWSHWDGIAVSPDGHHVAYLALTLADPSTFQDVYLARVDGAAAGIAAAFTGNTEGAPVWTPDGAVVFAVRETEATSAGTREVTRIYRQRPSPAPADRRLVATMTRYPTAAGSACHDVELDGRISVSPSGALILTCTNAWIYRMERDGAVPVALYEAPVANGQRVAQLHAPTWSPTGTQIAFIEQRSLRDASGFTRVMRMDADGGNVTPLVSLPIPADAGTISLARYNDVALCWTADGRHIVFTVPQGSLTSHLFVVSADGGAATRLTSAPGVTDASVSCTR